MSTIEEQLEDMSIPVPRLPRTPRSIPIFGRDAAIRIQAMTERYKLQGDTGLGDALMKIYFSHHELWLPHAQDARASTRAAAKINFVTKKYMSLLSQNVTTFAHLLTAAAAPTDNSRLAMGDVSMLTLLLRRLLFNSNLAKGAKSARGRGKDPLAVTVAAELGRLYDKLGAVTEITRAATGLAPIASLLDTWAFSLQLRETVDVEGGSLFTYARCHCGDAT
jgi:hypothetical protein